MDLLTSARAMRGWAVANLLANMAIIWTGALVRLTKSGLGCSTWPRCMPESYVPVPETGVHGLIEFGNRLLTFVLVAIAVATFVTALRRAQRGLAPKLLPVLALAVGLGIIAQAVIGGVSVLLQLNPWVVGLHMVASVLLILVCVQIVHLAFEAVVEPAPARLSALTWVVFALGMVTILLGVVVTGAGPHAGDGAALRNGLSTEWTAKVHAWSVWLLLALTVLGLVWSRGNVRLRRLWLGLAAVIVVQGLIGYVQYFTALPVVVVGLHMVGTTLFTAAIGHLAFLTAREPAVPDPLPADAA